MKILHVIPSIALVRGGPSQVVFAMVKALRNQGIDAEIATTNDNGADLLDVPLGQLIEYQKVPVWFFPRFSPKINAIREFAFSAQLTTWLWQNINQYDVIHIHAIFSYPSTMGMFIARLKNIPYICRPIGQLCQWSLQQGYRKKQIYLNLIEKSNIQHSKALHLTTEAEFQELKRLNFKIDHFILPLGMSIAETIVNAQQKLRDKLGIASDEAIILFMSRIHPKKGLDYLLQALAKLKTYPFKLIIAGSGSPEYEIEIKKLITEIKLNDHIYFTGFVDGEIKNLLLQGSDLFALTSYSENFGIAVLEALAAGLPVLVTPGVALASLVENNQLGYVTSLEIEQIVLHLEQFLKDRTMAKIMGDRSRKLVQERYSWEQIANRLIKIYQKILENS
jgi:glycosyltransferase involved in cell wall biosynthesis